MTRTKNGRACFDFCPSASPSRFSLANFVSSMSYPPVPYPRLLSASSAPTAASSERANPASPAPSRDHASSSSMAPSPCSLSLSRSPATSVPQESPQASSSVSEPSSPLSQLSKLSTPFRFPRPTYSSNSSPSLSSFPRLTIVEETAHDFIQRLMRTRTIESPVRDSGEKSEFATKFPGQFGTFKTPTKRNMDEGESEGGEETGKRKKRKRVEGTLAKDGSSLDGIDDSRYALVHVPWPKKCVCGD